MWFSELSLGEVTRIAANQYLPTVNLCDEIGKIPPGDDSLPRKCPVEEGRHLPFQTQIGEALWKGVDDYRSTVVGASGQLELRLHSGPPCEWYDTACEEPETLLGLTLPFVIVEKETHPKGGYASSETKTKTKTETEAEASTGKPAENRDKCEDRSVDCTGWAKDGECTANPDYMAQECRASCGLCQEIPVVCKDKNPECAAWAKDGQCTANPDYMKTECVDSCGLCPKVADEL